MVSRFYKLSTNNPNTKAIIHTCNRILAVFQKTSSFARSINASQLKLIRAELEILYKFQSKIPVFSFKKASLLYCDTSVGQTHFSSLLNLIKLGTHPESFISTNFSYSC